MWTDTTRVLYARKGMALPSDLTEGEWPKLIRVGDHPSGKLKSAIPTPGLAVIVSPLIKGRFHRGLQVSGSVAQMA